MNWPIWLNAAGAIFCVFMVYLNYVSRNWEWGMIWGLGLFVNAGAVVLYMLGM